MNKPHNLSRLEEPISYHLLLNTFVHNKHKILIIGGYGQVGQLIATRLAPHFPRQVIIAGRNLSKAHAMAAKLGHGIEARTVDLYAADAIDILDGVKLFWSVLIKQIPIL